MQPVNDEEAQEMFSSKIINCFLFPCDIFDEVNFIKNLHDLLFR